MSEQARGRHQGTLEIIKYNRHQYLGALVFLAVAIALLLVVDLPSTLRIASIAAICVAGFWSVTSIVVSYFVYDASRIYDPAWMRTLLEGAPSKWANLHAGVDDFSKPLTSAYGQPRYNWDIFDPDTMTEPSILRARSLRGNDANTAATSFRELPCENDELDAIFAFFVLHEIRDQSLRQQCFGEIARCTSAGAALVVVEHFRDLPNFVAFGPGFFHFIPKAEWLRSASASGFELVKETTMTPFVSAMVFMKRRTDIASN